MSSRKALLVSAAAGLLCALLAYLWLSARERELIEMGTPGPVLVAVKHIPIGTWVDESLVRVKRIPRAYVQPGALTSPQELKGHLALAPIAPGEQVLANKLSPYGHALSLTVPPDLRAVSVAVDPSASVAGLIKPGDLVDVFVTLDDRETPKTFALIQAAPILAVGQTFVAEPDAERSEGWLGGGGIDTVTLAASPFEAQQLTHLELIGRIKLALRSPGDREAHPLPELEGRNVEPAGRQAIRRR